MFEYRHRNLDVNKYRIKMLKNRRSHMTIKTIQYSESILSKFSINRKFDIYRKYRIAILI